MSVIENIRDPRGPHLVSVLDLDNSVRFSRDIHERARKHSVQDLPPKWNQLRSTPYPAQSNSVDISLYTMSIRFSVILAGDLNHPSDWMAKNQNGA